MGRVIPVLGFSVVIVLSLVAAALASELGVFSDLSGEHQYSSAILSDSGWKSAPEDPKTVYISIVVPNLKLREAIKSALDNVTRSHGLKPVYVNGSIADYDLKGRIVIVYLPMDFSEDGFLRSEYGVSGILYYSYPGDAKTFAELMRSRNVPEETRETIEKLALELSSSSVERLKEERVLNQSMSVAYWWNLRAVIGKLRKGDSYRMIAKEIATQLNEFLEGS
ncbi:hypothetical protein [Thermococcus gorgonarius]|uniref:Uncharacterized protein n=1 Tax=Thermococcus gorgonarius TaxID=71997 RepID=A0A2Z2MG63_THEGO|nr:hypothetical protein [Thermococcus gorgonarius]ASJ00938.1 hypothetical protein A3K92_05300 [Thermococcus gorgonarius]